MRKEIQAPDLALARPRTRREIFKLAAVGLGAAAAGTSVFSGKANAQATGVASDIELLNFAYTN
ncbi:MAG: hypothetical protein M3Q49_21935, partial [Actinomycetota bacterium]|nr:hypothetical protein [Actinomycetota bacterium]